LAMRPLELVRGAPQYEESIPFFGCAREYELLSDSVGRCIQEVLQSGRVLQGPEVANLEAALTGITARRHAVAVGSGTDALFFALQALGIGEGAEVLVPDLTFIASVSAILRCGAKPIFVDIDESCNLDLRRAAEKITPRSQAMLFVQLYGGMTDPAQIEAFANRHGLVLLEDAAQSFGARHGARLAGSTGHAAALSFDPTKVIGAPGSGGAVVTDDPAIAHRVRRLRLHGKEGDAFVELGYNSQLPSLAAAVLSLKLKEHKRWSANRQRTAEYYDRAFAGLPVSRPKWDREVFHMHHKYTIETPARDELREHLAGAGVPTQVHYATPIHKQALFSDRGERDEDFPQATRVSRETVSLPMHSHLTEEEIERIAQSVRRFFI
jgi:dTDP-4-amino-4,6-dideoxygalactose transaminase